MSTTSPLDSSGVVTRGHPRNWATLAGLVVSTSLFAVLYMRLDVRAVWAVIRSASPFWLALSTGAIVPLTMLVALRFQTATPLGSQPTYREAIRLTLVATAFNMFLPSKSGDIIKSYFVAKRGNVSTGVALSIIVYERLCDFLGLITWCLIGWLIHPPAVGMIHASGWIFLTSVGALCVVLVGSERSAGWLFEIVHRLLPSRRLKRLRDLAAGWPSLHLALRRKRLWVVLISLGLWLGHLTQMWMFTLAVSASVPFETGLGIFGFALLAGQLPLTFAGIGSRDVALVVLLSGYVPPETAAAIGLLSATRGIVPALAALPIMRPYLATAVSEARRWRQKA